MSPRPFVEYVPTELVFQVLSALSFEELKNFSLCSKSFRAESLPVLFRRIKLELEPTEILGVLSAFRDEGPLAGIGPDVKRARVFTQSSLSSHIQSGAINFNDMVKAYQIFANYSHLFHSLTDLILEIYVPSALGDNYPDIDQRLFHSFFRALERNSPAYHTIKHVSLKVRTPENRGSEVSLLGAFWKEFLDSRDFLDLPIAVGGDVSGPPAPSAGTYFPPNLEELQFTSALHQIMNVPVYPLSRLITARETLTTVCLNLVQRNGKRRVEDYSFPTGDFPNVKTLRIHPHFLYDGAKPFQELVRVFPNVEDLTVYIARMMFAENRLAYVEDYDYISLFTKVKNIRTFWMEEKDYEHGSEFLGPWELEGVVDKWVGRAKMLESVTFVRNTPVWRRDATDIYTLEAVLVRVRWKDFEGQRKPICRYGSIRVPRLEFDMQS
ncbi:hypothetical protein TWF481_012224 [Arthrobotrys musiformis]|uniref:F-box domain-containing protein n=1 Tax=Arthrobotrys musiformis TaxID=47236 RepID=A0AAV9VXH1_9PEZI